MIRRAVFNKAYNCVLRSLRRSKVQTKGLAHLVVAVSLACLSQSLTAADPTANASIRFETYTVGNSVAPIKLVGRDARWQVLVTKRAENGRDRDVTSLCAVSIAPENVVRIDNTGLLFPIQNGSASLTANFEGESILVPIEVSGFDQLQPVNFANQVVPVFTKFGCNGGGCHGKMAGQNGFKLSLLGFEPKEDYEHLVLESRGRRLFPSSPDQSLLLTKAINASPHGGGQRLEMDSYEYRLLRRWIEQAMPYGSEKDPKVVGIDVVPSERQMERESTQQLSVLARYSDGSYEDITRTAQFESNSVDMAEVSVQGMVKTRQLAGDVSVMARYQGQVAVFRASIPLGQAPATLPEPKGRIDVAVINKLRTLGIPPSQPCDDSTFLRRVTLDIAGRIPTMEEAQSFLSDPSPTKRSTWIDRMLDSPEYADNFASKWNAILRNRRTGAETQYGAYAFHDWIRQSIYENKPYDLFVREILTASGTVETNPPVVWYREVANTESRVEDAAQLFLGQRVQCARCHHHPFEKWSQNDYYQLSAFFSLVDRKEGRSPQEPIFVSRVGGAGASNPKTGQGLKPAGLDAPTLDLPTTSDPRAALADWMVAKKNPFFAKSVVNRYWKHFMGKGLIEPEDDMRVTNPPSNPELMAALEQELVESNFDLKHLIRAICNSASYQFGSDANELNIKDTNSFSRYYPKRLNAEVLLDSLDQLCGTTTPFDGMPAGTRAVSLPDTSFGSYFLTVFGRPESSTACECERTQSANLAQSLHLLNSKEIQAKLSVGNGRPAVWSADTTTPPRQRIEQMYLIAYSRMPTVSEMDIALNYIEKKKDKLREAYEDLTWAIINSKEFLFNH